MKIVYTKHAKDMLVLRNIQMIKVEECINNPDHILPGKFGKKAYLKDFGTNYLKLIVAEEKDRKVVVTLYWLAKKRVKV
jgi:hypothetical protein